MLKLCGRTTAANVIIYYWQTDINGYYSPGEGMIERAERHGHICGWIKSDKHVSVKEPDIQNEYYNDEFVFDDDELLLYAIKIKKPADQRGNGRRGSGVLRVLLRDDLQITEHNIVLGLNIPNCPETRKEEFQSGLDIGEGLPSFSPHHAYGPDNGPITCPLYRYGRYHGIICFVGDNPEWVKVENGLYI